MRGVDLSRPNTKEVEESLQRAAKGLSSDRASASSLNWEVLLVHVYLIPSKALCISTTWFSSSQSNPWKAVILSTEAWYKVWLHICWCNIYLKCVYISCLLSTDSNYNLFCSSLWSGQSPHEWDEEILGIEELHRFQVQVVSRGSKCHQNEYREVTTLRVWRRASSLT